jgi:hypothetical protein
VQPNESIQVLTGQQWQERGHFSFGLTLNAVAERAEMGLVQLVNGCETATATR